MTWKLPAWVGTSIIVFNSRSQQETWNENSKGKDGNTRADITCVKALVYEYDNSLAHMDNVN